MKEQVKSYLKKYWYELLLSFLLITVTVIFIVISISKEKFINHDKQDLGVVNLSYETNNIIQKQVYNANDIHVDIGTGIYFLGFVSLPDGDNPNVIDWSNFIYDYDETMNLIITSERPGLYYYLPYLDYIHSKPISTIIVRWNYIVIIFMDDTVKQFSRTSEEMQEMQLVYSDVSQEYSDGYSNGYHNGLTSGQANGYENGKNDFGYNDNGTIIPGQNAYDLGYLKGSKASGEFRANIIDFIPGVLGSIFMFFFQLGQIGILGITILDILGMIVLISGLIFLIKFFF